MTAIDPLERSPLRRTNALLPISRAVLSVHRRSSAAVRLRMTLSLASILPRQGFCIPIKFVLPSSAKVLNTLRASAFQAASALGVSIKTRTVADGLLVMCRSRTTHPAPIDEMAFPLVDGMDTDDSDRNARRSVEWQMVENTIAALEPGAWFEIPAGMFEDVNTSSVAGNVRRVAASLDRKVTCYEQEDGGLIVMLRTIALAKERISDAS